MISFSTDADILKYEPILFAELHLPGQVLATGTDGQLSGTAFTDSSADFAAAQVSAGGVIHLQSADGLLDGSYEIVAVDSATQLTVSVVRANSDDEPMAPPAASEITYRIGTFAPQAIQVAYQLTEYFGIKPGNPASSIEVQAILNTDVLKRASVFGVISHLYAMLASKADEENCWKKILYYQKLFEKARQRCRLSIDTGQDGVADVVKDGSSARLMRD
jgi:hypothetical protein